jgi:hypothetical protein
VTVLLLYVSTLLGLIGQAWRRGDAPGALSVITGAFRRKPAVAALWQAAIVLRRVAVVLAFSLLRGAGDENARLATTNAVSVAFAMAHLVVLPFVHAASNHLEGAALAGLVGMLLLLQGDASGGDGSGVGGTGAATVAAFWLAALGTAVLACAALLTARHTSKGRASRREQPSTRQLVPAASLGQSAEDTDAPAPVALQPLRGGEGGAGPEDGPGAPGVASSSSASQLETRV